ncbi:putative quiescin sulfhydryl oxidase [Trypanosoma conorhini]|uniref:Sulfhydryl oxidase n=1 Tax=Trypanosoma conorhini TaxID=83891 RepID=A0A3R7MTB7_9TRYP|nr:putative quiescin sulfhydryl oxidase [Trypanosoma conorhini]RNF07799.1 putative quiescin sulfhydryl oxidase [Trypanosoma conorhini]
MAPAMPSRTGVEPKCFVVWCALLLAAASGVAEGQLVETTTTDSLFAEDAAVVELAGTNWSLVHRSAPLCPWVVLFYSGVCGHCRAIAPAYRTFAAQLEECHEEDPLRAATPAAVNCVTEAATCREYAVSSVPMLLLFLPSNCSTAANETCDAAKGRYVVMDSSRQGLSQLRLQTRRGIKQLRGVDGPMLERCASMRHALYAEKKKQVHRVTGPPAPFVETRELYATDVAGAFFLTMWHEVSLVGLDSPKPLLALQNFLRLVERALAGLGAGALLEAVKRAEGGEAFSVMSWQKAVIAARIPYEGDPREVRWRTCGGSSPKYRGFPCAMWLLYHSLTVNVDAAATAEINPLETIQSYVQYFFSCVECRQHFQQFTFSRDKDPVLQLWRAHNEVNARLAAVTAGADPFVPKRQFPDPALCVPCRDASGAFQEEEVAKYLRKRYEWDPDAVARQVGGGTIALPPREADGAEPANGNSERWNREQVRHDPLPLHVFLTFFVIVALVSAGILRTRRRYIGSVLHHRSRQKS